MWQNSSSFEASWLGVRLILSSVSVEFSLNFPIRTRDLIFGLQNVPSLENFRGKAIVLFFFFFFWNSKLGSDVSSEELDFISRQNSRSRRPLNSAFELQFDVKIVKFRSPTLSSVKVFSMFDPKTIREKHEFESPFTSTPFTHILTVQCPSRRDPLINGGQLNGWWDQRI